MLNPDFRDMLSAFSDAGVDYLVVGAYALAVHGIPRATGDIDFWIRPTPDNARRVLDALIAFGAPVDELTTDDFVSPGRVIQLGLAPARIDILTSIDGVGFDDAWPNRVETEVDGRPVLVIGRADLIRNKTAVGRPRDLADVAELEERE